MSRAATFVYGIVTYVAFIGTGVCLIGFVGNFLVCKSIDSGRESPWPQALSINLLLILLFAVQHSGMARRSFKDWWTRRVVAEAAERSTYVLFSSAALCLLMWQWRPMPALVWHVHGDLASWLLHALAVTGSGLALAASFLLNHFELFGVQQGCSLLQDRRPPESQFLMPGPYRFVRHPMMTGLLIALWSTPRMSSGRLAFAAALTAYVYIGTLLEERDLVRQFGHTYRAYQRTAGRFAPRISRRRSNPPAPHRA